MKLPLEALLTADEAARALSARGVWVFCPKKRTWRKPTADIVRRWCARGRLPSIRVGRQYLIYTPDVLTFTPPAIGRPRSDRASPPALALRKRRSSRPSPYRQGPPDGIRDPQKDGEPG